MMLKDERPLTDAQLIAARILTLIADDKVRDVRVALDVVERFLDRLKLEGLETERLSDLKDLGERCRDAPDERSRVH